MRTESVPVDLKPHCMVCPNELPLNRARNTYMKTCSPECAELLKKWRLHQEWLRYCPSCLHPSTPEQREDFKRWRTARGERIGDKEAGRPAKKREKALATVLGECREIVEDALIQMKNNFSFPFPPNDPPIEGQNSDHIRELDSLLMKISKLLDLPAAK